jgi:hypothetical protein
VEATVHSSSTVYIRSKFDFIASGYPTSDAVRSEEDDNESDSDSATASLVTLDSLMRHLPTECPTVFKVSTADSMLLHHSHLLTQCRKVYYLSNEYVTHSRDIIDMMVQAGKCFPVTLTYSHTHTLTHSHTHTLTDSLGYYRI